MARIDITIPKVEDISCGSTYPDESDYNRRERLRRISTAVTAGLEMMMANHAIRSVALQYDGEFLGALTLSE